MSEAEMEWPASLNSVSPRLINEELELLTLASRPSRRCNIDNLTPRSSSDDGVETRLSGSLNDIDQVQPTISSAADGSSNLESNPESGGITRQQLLNTELLEAVRWSNYTETMKLLAAGANPNATCQSKTRSRTNLVSVCHFAALNDDKILSELIKAGADTKTKCIPWGCTPLHLAAWAGNLTNMGLLLGLSEELQKKLDHERAMTVEIEEELIKLRPDLIDLVNIRCNTQNIKKVSEDWLDNCSAIHETWLHSLPSFGHAETPLHSASSMPRAHAVRFLLAAGADPLSTCYDFEGDTPLVVAGSCVVYYKVRNHIYDSELKEVVQVLLSKEKQNRNITKRENFTYKSYNLEKVLCTAVTLEDVDTVLMLLKAGANPKWRQSDGHTASHIAVRLNNIEIAKMIIKFDKTTIHCVDRQGYTPLHTASHYSNRDAIVLLLKEGADLSAVQNMSAGLSDIADSSQSDDGCSCSQSAVRVYEHLFGPRRNTGSIYSNDDFKETPIQQILDHVEKPTEFLEEIFDSCIAIEGCDVTLLELPSRQVTIDYDILRHGTTEYIEINVIQALLNTGNRYDQRRLLIHPLVESFIFLKWKAILPLYYTMLIFYGLFTISLTTYILYVFNYKDINSDVPTWVNCSLISAVYVFITLNGVLEILFYLNMTKQNLLRGELWIKFISLLLGGTLPAIIMMSPNAMTWTRHLATMLILLSWTEITLLMSRVFEWGYYVQMFNKVAFKAFKILTTFAGLLIGFTFCFMIQFHTKNQFGNFWAALVKTIVMMTSEFEYDDLVTNNENDVLRNLSANSKTGFTSDDLRNSKHDENEGLDSSLIMIRLTFLMFLILAAIVLMNLMIGVAVDDLNDLKLSGNIMKLEKQVEFLALVETNKFLMRILPKIIKSKFSVSPYTRFSINTEGDRPARCNRYDNGVPLHIRKAIINIAYSNRKKISNVQIDIKHLQKDKIVQDQESVPRDYAIVDRDCFRKFEYSLIQVKDRINNLEYMIEKFLKTGNCQKSGNLCSSPPPILPVKFKDQESVPGNFILVERNYLSKLTFSIIELKKIIDNLDDEIDLFLKMNYNQIDRDTVKLSAPPSPVILSKKLKVKIDTTHLQKDKIVQDQEPVVPRNNEIVERDYLRKLNYSLNEIKKRIEVLEYEVDLALERKCPPSLQLQQLVADEDIVEVEDRYEKAISSQSSSNSTATTSKRPSVNDERRVGVRISLCRII